MEPLLIIAIAVVLVVGAVAAVLWWRARSSAAAPPRSVSPSVRPSAPEAGLRFRLGRSRAALAASLGTLFSPGALGEDVWQDLEDTLIVADVGPGTAATVVEAVRRRHPSSGHEAREILVEELVAALEGAERSLGLGSSPSVIVVVGVNGTGKTTSIAKIANLLVTDGKSVVLGAADTFRAAADTQLKAWGERVGVPVVSGNQGSDPASVAYEALDRARTEGADVVIIDTAGRLHSQSNLMEELGKVVRVLAREAGAIDEVLLVLDGAVGQNGVAQARAFTEAVGVTGIVITKLDGTPKGGVAIGVEKELGVPVKLIGVGEGMADLVPFDPREFVEALVAE